MFKRKIIAVGCCCLTLMSWAGNDAAEMKKNAKDDQRKVKEQAAATKKIENELRNVVLQAAKDPDSVKFGKVTMVSSMCACVEANARNSYGGYGGMQAVMLGKINSQWKVVMQTEDTANCIHLLGFNVIKCDGSQ